MASATPTKNTEHHRFAELDVVRLRFDTAEGTIVYRGGTLGTIVHMFEDCHTFMVEFDDPEPTVLTLERLDVTPVFDEA